MTIDKMRILYLDDDKNFFELTIFSIEEHKAPIEVVYAATVEEAIRLFDNQSFDLVISDYALVGDNGISFLKYVRKVRKSCIPFVIITGVDDRVIAVEAINNGADYYLEKSAIISDKTGSTLQSLQAIVEDRRALNEMAMIDSFGAMFSVSVHDIKNNLTVIGMTAEAIDITTSDSEIRGLVRNISNCQRLTLDILNYAVDYYNFGHSKPNWNAIHPIIEKIKRQISYKIEVINDIPDDLELFSDRLIEKVFYNLCENAVRHGRANRIKFSSFREHDYLVIEIHDNGCGIPTDEKKIMFDEGYGKNTGFGLAFCKKILRKVNISIGEDGNGSGANFTITVPEIRYRYRKHFNT